MSIDSGDGLASNGERKIADIQWHNVIYREMKFAWLSREPYSGNAQRRQVRAREYINIYICVCMCVYIYIYIYINIYINSLCVCYLCKRPWFRVGRRQIYMVLICALALSRATFPTEYISYVMWNDCSTTKWKSRYFAISIKHITWEEKRKMHKTLRKSITVYWRR